MAGSGWQLGEHNSWHKFTNFELGTRVPLIIRAPMLPSSVGQTAAVLAELVDVMPTLAELAGAPLSTELASNVDGTSLAPVMANPSVVSLPNDKGTFNKSVAYSMYPHSSDFGCSFWGGEGDGLCYADGNMMVSPLGLEALPFPASMLSLIHI